MLQNTIQIANQFKYLQTEYKKAFLFKDYHQLNEVDLLSLEYEIQSTAKERDYSKTVIFLNFFNQKFNLFKTI